MGMTHIDKLIRTKRKTVALQVNDRAEIVVRAPQWVSQKFIVDFVQKHAEWIETRKKEIGKRPSLARAFIDEERFVYLGKEFPLTRTHRGRSLMWNDGRFFLGRGVKDPKKAFENWYKKEAKKFIIPRVQELALLHDFSYGEVRITSAKTRWGSCSAKKNLSFSWRLMLMPRDVVDYVILHELAHLKHMDHSALFWKCVHDMCPEYVDKKKQLHVAATRGNIPFLLGS
jgi:predicted metal-dependent hydrolase